MGDLCEVPKNMDGARRAQSNKGEFTLGNEQPQKQTQMSTVELGKGINLDKKSGVRVRQAEHLRAQEQKDEAGHPTELTRVKPSSSVGKEYQHDVAKGSRRSGPASRHTSKILPRGHEVDSKAETVGGTSGVAREVRDPVYGTPPRAGAKSRAKASKQTPTIVMREPAKSLSIGRPQNARPPFTENRRRNSQKRRRRGRSRRRRKNFCC